MMPLGLCRLALSACNLFVSLLLSLQAKMREQVPGVGAYDVDTAVAQGGAITSQAASFGTAQQRALSDIEKASLLVPGPGRCPRLLQIPLPSIFSVPLSCYT
jgi:hypothetical protein